MSNKPDSNNEIPPTVDCYSAGDRGFMQWGQSLRASVLRPLLAVLIRFGITENQLTAIALVFGLAFAPLFLVDRMFAFIALALHVALDGIDGPLARARGTASNRGSFTDTAADQLVVCVSTAALVEAGLLTVSAGVIYVFAYTIVVGFSMVRNALAIPYSWVVRPRFFVYTAAVVECYGVTGVLRVVVVACNVLLIWKAITGFVKIRRKL